jgi:hypothetical protein
MAKRTALTAGMVILDLGLPVARSGPFRWWQGRQAKLWCEELAVLMERTGCDRLKTDLDCFEVT